MRIKKTKINYFLHNLFLPNKLFITLFLLLNIIILFNTFNAKNRLDSYFRIHVVANSDSIQDQLLKYQIADKVNAYINTIYTKSLFNKDDSKYIITNNIQQILQICQDTIHENR